MSRDAWTRYAPGGSPHYDVVMPGFKYNMMDLQAAIGLHQLARLGAMHARREAICARYDDGLADLPLFRPAPPAAGIVHARHLYPVLVDAALVRDVARRAAAAAARGAAWTRASTSAPCTCTPYYRERFGFARGMFPARRGRVGLDAVAAAVSGHARRRRRSGHRGAA